MVTNFQDIRFDKLSIHHIDKGWYEWIKNMSNDSQVEFIRTPPNREDLEKIIKNESNSDIWLAASRVIEEDNKKSFKYFANVHISQISWIDRRCIFGRMIGEKGLRGKGLGTLLTQKILSFSFNSLGMHKVTAGCSELNEGAIKSNLRAGMVREAILKKDRFYQGRFLDTHLFAAWSDTWKIQ